MKSSWALFRRLAGKTWHTTNTIFLRTRHQQCWTHKPPAFPSWQRDKKKTPLDRQPVSQMQHRSNSQAPANTSRAGNPPPYRAFGSSRLLSEAGVTPKQLTQTRILNGWEEQCSPLGPKHGKTIRPWCSLQGVPLCRLRKLSCASSGWGAGCSSAHTGISDAQPGWTRSAPSHRTCRRVGKRQEGECLFGIGSRKLIKRNQALDEGCLVSRETTRLRHILAHTVREDGWLRRAGEKSVGIRREFDSNQDMLRAIYRPSLGLRWNVVPVIQLTLQAAQNINRQRSAISKVRVSGAPTGIAAAKAQVW